MLRLIKEYKLRNAIVIIFLGSFALRLVPEILAGPWPLGFDTITYYVPTILNWADGDFSPFHFSSFTPFCCFLLFSVYTVSGSVFLALKILGPLLYGFLCSSFFFFAAKGLGWNNKKGFSAALLFSIYFLSLRISWDLYRNMLGLAFFFLFLSFLPKFDDLLKSRKFIASTLTILVTLSHEIVSAVMFFVVFGGFALDVFKHKSPSKVFKSSLWFMPSLFIFFLIVYSNAIAFHNVPGCLNYFTDKNRGITYDSYFVLAGDIFIFFFLIFGLLLPFVIAGFWRDRTLDSWSLICLLGSFWPIFYPWFEVVPWNRWMLMLNPPFILYAANGIEKLKITKRKVTLNGGTHAFFSRQTSIFMVIVIISVGFMILPLIFSPYTTVPPTLERLSFYIPGGMISNTFPISDCEDLQKSLEWVNGKLDNRSVLIIHESLTGWAKLYLSDGKNVINYHFLSHFDGLQEALSAGYERVYLIWWVDGYGWYGQKSVPREFNPTKPAFVSSHVAVYLYIRK